MFFLIVGIVSLVVVALAIIGFRFFHDEDTRVITGISSGIVATLMLILFFIQVGDKCSIQRRLDTYTKDGYQFGIYRVITELEYHRPWADTPFSIWTNEEIDKGLKKASQAYREEYRRNRKNGQVL